MANRQPADFIPNKVRAFMDGLVYCRGEYKDALTMGMFVSHARDHFTAVPYFLATSDVPESGKSTITFDIPMMLAYAPESVDKQTTRDALNNMYLDRVRPNLICDDIGKIFGESGQNGKLTNLYTLLVKSYRRKATTSMSRNGSRVEVPTYGMAFLNGLRNAVPHDLFTRCIWFQMEPAPDGLNLRDALDTSVEAEATILKEAIHAWAGQHSAEFEAFMRGPVRRIHPKLEKRKRQLWGPLFAAAYAAGGDWPRRIFDAFIAIALDVTEKPVLVADQRALLDASGIVMQRDLSEIFISDLIEALRELPEGAFYRETETEYLVNMLFPEAFGTPERVTSTVLYGEHKGQRGRAMGYEAVRILHDAAALRDMLYPPMEIDVQDPLADALAFEPVQATNHQSPTPLVMAGMRGNAA